MNKSKLSHGKEAFGVVWLVLRGVGFFAVLFLLFNMRNSNLNSIWENRLLKTPPTKIQGHFFQLLKNEYSESMFISFDAIFHICKLDSFLEDEGGKFKMLLVWLLFPACALSSFLLCD